MRALTLALTGLAVTGAVAGVAAKLRTPPELVDWVGVGGSVGEPHYGAIDQINRATVKNLGLVWSLELPGEHALEATPLAMHGTLYFTGQGAKIYAVNAVTGTLIWSYDPEVWKYRPRHPRLAPPVNRGLAYAEGKVFVGTMDGRLIAVDAYTGKEVWSVKTVADDSYYTITGAPRIVKNKVVIGNGGGDLGARGFVTAYDYNTGKQAWRFYTVPGNPADGFENEAMKKAAATWSGRWWEVGTGGTVWNGMVYDPALNLLYIGTGNSGPYNPRLRNPGGGDNLFLTSIVALNPDTGAYVWHYQANPNEAWDYKATADLILADLTIGGRKRQVVMQAPTNGFFYVLDRKTGELLSAGKYDKVTWADHVDIKTGRPVEAPGIRYENAPIRMWPGAMGAHNWQPMAYSPRTGLVYVPAMTQSSEYTGFPALVAHPVKRTIDSPWTGATGVAFDKADASDGYGSIVAWDPVAQKERWRVRYPNMWNGGVLATAGDLVFQGDGEGILHGYDAASGRELWRFDAKLGITGAPITYVVGGKQYVSILVGYGGNANAAAVDSVSRGWKYGAQPRRLLTFALGGKAKLPPTAPRDMTLRALDDPKLVLDEAAIGRGEMVFATHCLACHGLGARSPGVPGPDLRESPIALSLPAFTALLQKGGLQQNGMPIFDDFSADTLRDVHMYIRAMAREALGTRKVSRAKTSGV
jgi:quinohemoprotein ethanol dehydrogenase